MIILCNILLLLWLVTFSLVLLGTYLATKHFSKKRALRETAYNLLPISILKPIKGIGPTIEKDIESFFYLDYPAYEIIFSIADGDDPVRSIIEKLITKYHHVKAKLIIGDVAAGFNPKINNLIKSYAQAKHDWILISDGNARVGQRYLKKMASHIDAGVGVVTAIIAGCEPKNLSGYLESIYMNTFYARGMFLAELAGHSCVLGKSMLFRKSQAERFGGLKTMARYLAEDYMTGRAMTHLGLKTIIMKEPVYEHIGHYSWKLFWSRHIRWARIRKNQALIPFLAEPLLNVFISALCGVIPFAYLTPINPLTFLSFHFGVWFLCDLAMIYNVKVDIDIKLPLAWLVREFVALPLWTHALCNNTVNWRGHKLKIQPGGTLESVPTSI